MTPSFLKPVLLALAVSVTAVAAGPAMAFDDADRAGMAAAVDQFNAAFAKGDYHVVFDFMPPKVIAAIAAQAGMDEASLLAAMKAQIEAAMATVTIESFDMDVAGATYATTPDGSRDYALIPTRTLMSVEGTGRVRGLSQTLAFHDEGQWFLVRIDDPQQVDLLKTLYPEFKGVDFPPGSLEPAE